MSSFNMPALGGQDKNMKKVYSYIQMLNEQLRYSLSNITPENNFTKDSFLKYQETDESISQLEVTMNGFISQFTNLKESTETSIRVLNGQIALKVSKDKLCSEISATSDAITFKTGYLVIDTNNFKLYKDGTASFSGTINGGSININDKFKVSSSGAVSVDAITYADTITTQGLLYTNYMRISGNADVSGTLTANTVTVSGDVSCETLYERSDRRLKENIKEIPDEIALNLVLGMRPVTFKFNGINCPGAGCTSEKAWNKSSFGRSFRRILINSIWKQQRIICWSNKGAAKGNQRIGKSFKRD